MKKKLIIVIDGCPEEYFSRENTPNIFRMAENGFMKNIEGVMPSVTNVNHASILSGSFPENHRMVGNYYYDRETGEHGLIEDSVYMDAESIIDRYHDLSKTTALLTVKGKVLKVFGDNATYGINMQDLNPEWKEKFGLSDVPGVSDFAAYNWIFESCFKVIEIENPDLVYCTTNDFLQHNYHPETPEAQEVMHTIDSWIGKIYDLDKDREIYITADHGMNDKNRVIDLQKKLDNQGYHTFCQLALKDRYIDNHIYQEGGTVYVHVLNESEYDAVYDFLSNEDYIEYTYSAEEAASKLHLPQDNIGDIVVLTGKDAVFGELEDTDEINEKTRTHGTFYETTVPLIAVNSIQDEDYYKYTMDIVKGIFEAEEV